MPEGTGKQRFLLAQPVPLNLNLLERLGLQLLLTRGEAARLFPGALLDDLPPDARLYQVSIGSGPVLVAHHSVERLGTFPPQEGPGVWDLWTGELYWSQLNAVGERL